MSPSLKPIYLFADSQLLFWSHKDSLFLRTIKARLSRTSPSAAYLGASNGDEPQFYALFEAAMHAAGIRDCRMIGSSFSAEDKSFVQNADLILLAGGSVARGLTVFAQVGLSELIVQKYSAGTVIIGISAGAIQLGLQAIQVEKGIDPPFDTLRLVPYIVSAHDEAHAWSSLRNAIQQCQGAAVGIGISAGGGLVYYPDQSIEAVRYPLFQVSMKNGRLIDSWLNPK